MQLLQELCEAPGISGREQKIIDIMIRELDKTADRVSVDLMGNVIGFKKGRKEPAKKVMIAGHLDEIGFVESYIDKNVHSLRSTWWPHSKSVVVAARQNFRKTGNDRCD